MFGALYVYISGYGIKHYAINDIVKQKRKKGLPILALRVTKFRVWSLEFHYDPCVGSVKYLFWYLPCGLTWHIGDFCIYFSWIFLKKDILWRNIRLCTLEHQNHDFVTNSLYDLDRSKSHILQFCTTTTHWTILIVNFHNP